MKRRVTAGVVRWLLVVVGVAAAVKRVDVQVRWVGFGRGALHSRKFAAHNMLPPV